MLSHPALKGIGMLVNIPMGGISGFQPIHIREYGPVGNELMKSIEGESYQFVPLVRKSLELACELRIVFLRKDRPGALVLPGGDLDNRIKTFFDGLRIPDNLKGSDPEERSHDPQPLLCLLEQDSLITSFSIETDRLLTPDAERPNHVRLVVEAIVKVMRITENNVGFLGD
jgi:hypothetical protein